MKRIPRVGQKFKGEIFTTYTGWVKSATAVFEVVKVDENNKKFFYKSIENYSGEYEIHFQALEDLGSEIIGLEDNNAAVRFVPFALS